ncbi:DsrE family protein [Cohnella candidum]|uniref:Transcriptional regulator n=1 Tax=Cohnella candidum TaxID=2674991 RepID=A0A3G3K1M0_9BACL|nr:DsrE family protein [Cohnella candidum]AYQ74444.1 transcriptional regulator [Cohnella candidum]
MQNKVILLSTDCWGKGDEALGHTILETFFTLLKQEQERPAAVFCMHRGVMALTEASVVSLQLKELEQLGVPVLACKTCTDYFGVTDKLSAGEVSTMKRFIELSAEHEVFTIA